MVELVTINKHCREIARTLIKKISSTKQIKARTCCWFVCTLGYSLSLTIFRTRGMRCMRTWELHQLHTWYLQLVEYTWRYRHHTLGFWCRKAQKSKCGGDRWASRNRFIPYQGWCWFLLKSWLILCVSHYPRLSLLSLTPVWSAVRTLSHNCYGYVFSKHLYTP